MVNTWAPLTLAREVTHARTALPSTCTVQAPHCAMPQPYFVPVSLSSSRITQSSGVSASDFALTGLPFTVNDVIGPPWGRRHLAPRGKLHQQRGRNSRSATCYGYES